jgi:6-phosphogluconolactonase (cycloisomerase 2 family)
MNRRTFLAGIAAAAPVSLWRGEEFRYVACADRIEVFGRFGKVQSIPSSRPACLEFHPNANFLFAVNEVDNHQGLPAGSVESYSIHPITGRLTLVNRQGLSLSSTFPRGCAISPDGRHLIVAAYGGGTYNVLPINEAGVIGRPNQIIKEIGRGPHPVKQESAHPHSAVFHPMGRFLIATDSGCDRMTVFRFEDGTLTRVQQKSSASGSGPSYIKLSRDGSAATVWHELRPGDVSYKFDPHSGSLTEQFNG